MVIQFYKSSFPTLELNDSYYLREHSMKDIEDFYAYYSRPEVGKFILASRPNSIADAESELYYCRGLFKSQKGIYWTIAQKSTDRMVGAIGLYINNFHQRAELSYDLSPDYWRQGIMSASILRVTEFAFQTIQLQRLEAVTMLGNLASMNLLKKCGYLHEGTLRNYKYFQGRSHDIEMFSAVPPS